MQTVRKGTRHRIAVALHAAALSLVFGATTAFAQPKPVLVTAAKGVTEGALARSNWYVARAEAFDVGQGVGGYLELARLYRTAAELRGADTAAVTHFRMAAWSYLAGGDTTAALRVMTQGAQLADRLDDIGRAVDTWVNAALIAQAGGRHRELAVAIRQAGSLLSSPRLSAEGRIAVMRRIEAYPTLAGYFGGR